MNNIKKEEIRGHNRILIPFIFLILVLSFICIGAVSAAPGDTIYVNGAGGNDSWDGQSDKYNSTTGSGPKLSIKNATGTVNFNGTVHIADGVYSGENNTRIIISKNMNIVGQSQTGTVIDGSNTAQIFYIPIEVNVTMCDLTLINGNATRGGAIYINYNSILTIINSTLHHNAAVESGGAIYNYYSTLTTINCIFHHNAATKSGGAIYSDSFKDLNINNSIFNDNQAAESGGAISLNNYCNLNINNSTFNDNRAKNDGGAIYNSYGLSLTVSNSTFNYNTANQGGVIYSYGFGTLTLTNNDFKMNQANLGGVIYNIYGSGIVNFNRFLGNTANQGSFIYTSGFGTVNADKNWWGSNSDPKTMPNIIFVSGGSVNIDNWIILTLNAIPNVINSGQTTTIIADFNHINGGGDLIGGHIFDGIPVTFTTDWGSFTCNSNTTVNGESKTIFQANGAPPIKNLVKVYASADYEKSPYALISVSISTKLLLNEVRAYKGEIIKLTATLWDTYYKRPVSGQKVTFKIDGKIIGSAITNANGVATINYNDLNGKTSTITVEFPGSKLYANSKNSTQLIGEKKFALVVKNTGKSRIHVVYYVMVYKPNNAKAIIKKYNFYLNPGKSKKINIGTYPVGTTVTSNQFIYNTGKNKQKASLINTWIAQGLKIYTQKFMVKNVPSKQKRAVYAKNRFWINKNALNVSIIRKPSLK